MHVSNFIMTDCYLIDSTYPTRVQEAAEETAPMIESLPKGGKMTVEKPDSRAPWGPVLVVTTEVKLK